MLERLCGARGGAAVLYKPANTLPRLNRAKGMASIMITHSLADLDALASEEDRAKARGFADRSAITVLAGLPPRELARVREITPLTGPEQELVASWSAPDSWQPGARHPGRGKYLIKTGERLGIPVELSLVGAERRLYETDPQFGPDLGWSAAGSGGALAGSGAPAVPPPSSTAGSAQRTSPHPAARGAPRTPSPRGRGSTRSATRCSTGSGSGGPRGPAFPQPGTPQVSTRPLGSGAPTAGCPKSVRGVTPGTGRE